MIIKRLFLMSASFLLLFNSQAQDLDSLLNAQSEPETNFTTATFKSTRVLNGHSIERMPAGQLDVRISHRFGRVNTGAYELWGLDQASMHLGFEYGITNWLMVGVGRGTYEKAYDGFTKFSILRQSSGRVTMPVSVSVFTSVAVNSLKWQYPDRKNYFTSRMTYVGQILVARKFNDRLSLQLSPTYIHRNLVATELDPNDLYSMGIGGRCKITKRISVNAEYFYVLKTTRDAPSLVTYNPLSFGIDIETGGHVFQLIFTNSLPIIDKGFIGETTGSWLKKDIHFGFNLSRVFMLK